MLDDSSRALIKVYYLFVQIFKKFRQFNLDPKNDFYPIILEN